ncbi:MAG: hypothetical protein ABI651_08630 [Verrucomicrobiota bacterium]
MKTIVTCFAVMFLMTLPRIIRADQLVPLTIEQLTEHSQLIIHGAVLSRSCQRDLAGRIYTKVELEVSDVWKGALTNRVFTVVHGGGILGDRKATVSNQVEFEIGEEIVAFLVVNWRGESLSLGLAQGKFHVWQDTATQQKFACNPFHGNPAAVANREVLHRPAGSGGSLTLAELKHRVSGGNR